jgi:hypothetical protein
MHSPQLPAHTCSLSDFASATTNLYLSYLTTSNWVVALNVELDGTADGVFGMYPFLPSAVTTFLGKVFPSASASIDVS